MIATDPLSLVFVACVVFSGAFIAITAVLGVGHGHGTHVVTHAPVGGHAGHVHLGGHAHVGHVQVGGHAAPAAGAGGHLAPHLGMRLQLPGHAPTSAPAADAQSAPLPLRLLGGVNLNALLTFLFCFGLLGYLLHNVTQAGALVAVVLAVLAGLGASAGVNVLYLRLFGQESGRLGYDSSRLEGRVGKVSIPIRAGGIGEVIFVGDGGSRQSIGARGANGAAIARDTDIVILEVAAGVAVAQAWDDFLAGATGAPVVLEEAASRP